MATALISTSAELVLLNTTTRPGVVILPSTNTIPGRILTFKDTRGTFATNSITFSTASANQTLENNAIRATYTDPFGAYCFIAGFDNKWYTIGGSRMYAASISSITTIALTSQQISSGNITVSTLQFRDTATTSTNTLFSLSTNVYYSSPVSFFSLGPTKAPKSLFMPIRMSFLPNQISGLQLWLDAADVNTICIVNNLVTQWNDKSGNRRNMTNLVGTITYGTFQSRICVQQVIGSSLRVVSAVDLTSLTFFIVNCSISAANNQTVFAGMNSGSGFDYSSTVGFGFYIDGNTNPAGTRFYGTLTAGQFATNNITQTNIPYPFTIFVGRFTSAGALTTFVNGTAGGTGAVGTRLSGSQGFALASTQGSNINLANSGAFICEALVYNAALTDAQRQQTEGYLAWKWGLAGNLPSNHPFKNSPP
jgi:hypothetical protein